MSRVPLFLGPEHPCSYLDGRIAQMAYLSPELNLTRTQYSGLVASGFRRSGDLVYRTHCPGCSACIPVRVPVAYFRPNRAQSRVLRLNRDLDVVEYPPDYDEAHYQLYLRYQQARHPGGEMGQVGPDEYLRFLAHPRREAARFVTFRSGRHLLAVAVMDLLDDGCSAVYTFYEPEARQRSLGTYAVLWQIEAMRQRGLAHVYLGFWIAECRKMAYKSTFRPLERLSAQGLWQPVDCG